jgi:hypothetical protein
MLANHNEYSVASHLPLLDTGDGALQRRDHVRPWCGGGLGSPGVSTRRLQLREVDGVAAVGAGYGEDGVELELAARFRAVQIGAQLL